MPVDYISDLAGIVRRSGWAYLPSLSNRSLGCCLFRSFAVINTSLRKGPSLGPLHSVLSSKGFWVEVSILKGGLGEKCGAKYSRWSAPVTLPLASDSPLHGCLANAVMTIQKRALCLQVCLFWGHCHHQNGCSEQYMWGLSHGFLNKDAGHPIQPSAFIPLQHGLCLSVTCTGMFFTSHFQVERLVLRKCLTYPSLKDLKIVLSILKFCTKFFMKNFLYLANVNAGSHRQLLTQVQSIECIVSFIAWLH